MSKEHFWDKVRACKHDFNGDYCKYVGECDTPYCGSIDELHCTKCGVFRSECRCGCNNGMSGWSAARWIRRNRRNHEQN